MTKPIPRLTQAGAAAAALATILAFTPQAAHADSDRFELSGGHVDAFYVYNSPRETSVTPDGTYSTNIHLRVKEDVTAIGTLRDPNRVRFVTTDAAFTCFDEEQKKLFTTILPGATGAYVSDKTELGTSSILNPGYSTYVKFPDPEHPDDRNEDYSDDGLTLTFTDIDFPEGGQLSPYGVKIDLQNGGSLPRPELTNGEYTIRNGSTWELTSVHHHAKWVATKAGTYRFKVTATAERDGQSFTSNTAQYEWVFNKSALEGTCGASGENSEAGTLPAPDESAEPALPAEPSEPALPAEPEDAGKPLDPPAAEEPPATENPGTTKPDTQVPPAEGAPGTDGVVPPSSQPAKPGKITLDHGHADIFNVVAKDGKLLLNLKEDVTAPGTIRQPEDVTLKILESARKQISPKLYDGIITSGYALPLSGEPDLIWPGWETVNVRPDFSHIDIKFDEVTGPGRVQLLTLADFKLQPLLADNSIELKAGSVIAVPEPTHVHAYWLFENPGVYTMKVKASGKNDAGTLVTSNTATYTWHVGDFEAGSAGGTTSEPGDGPSMHDDTTESENGPTSPADGNATQPIDIADHTKVRITAPSEVAVERVDSEHQIGHEELAAAGVKVELVEGAVPLTHGVDYTVGLGDPTRTGNNKLIIVGLNKYAGSVELPIAVTLKDAKVTEGQGQAGGDAADKKAENSGSAGDQGAGGGDAAGAGGDATGNQATGTGAANGTAAGTAADATSNGTLGTGAATGTPDATVPAGSSGVAGSPGATGSATASGNLAHTGASQVAAALVAALLSAAGVAIMVMRRGRSAVR
ncbi:choice-of-anchor M domain-containing protein [Trueperella pecoris]|uniref:Choice-of-anchor M domain-containing protein n=1 Tax=Trueperella pecoris TaxID=2733571 RepID=A0A7M1R2J5_9ACTO|nr:choice-of-anchor M domain-containing protein [Trueperella pecoris]QOR47697.1 choice-of-anchor M domain-containing protein [Trueperella pecoris]